MEKNFKIGNRTVSKNSKPLIIAEVGQSHLGSLKKCLRIIDELSLTGVDIVKFQTHIAKSESTYDEPFRKKISNRYISRFDYWKDMEFTYDEWKKIKRYTESKKLIFLSSPFSVDAFSLLHKLRVTTFKIGSGEFFSNDLLDEIIKKKKKIILSTGLSTINEIQNLTDILKRKKINFILLQCTSKYPLSLKEVGINVLSYFKDKIKCFYGLSDHSGSIYPSIFALCLGSKIVEIHYSNKNNLLNPDHSSSINFKNLKSLCKARDEIFIMNKYKVNKSIIDKLLRKTKLIFTKSLVVKKNKSKNEIILRNDLTLKKPGTGIHFDKINIVIGKKLKKNVTPDKLLRYSDFIK